MPPDLQQQIQQTLAQLVRPFWHDPGYWLSLLVGIGALAFSLAAWREARKAKAAAFAAGRTVKLQTVTIELSEVSQRLDRVQPGIRFSEARDLLSDASRRVHRALSPFSKEQQFAPGIVATFESLKTAQEALRSVRPTVGAEDQAPEAVYYGVENVCSTLSTSIADLIGLFENHALIAGEVGEKDAELGDKRATVVS